MPPFCIALSRPFALVALSLTIASCGQGTPLPDSAAPTPDGAPSLDAAVATPPNDAAAPLDATARTVSGTYVFSLDAGAFAPTPAHPSVLVYLPSGFRPTPPLDVIVFLHGFDNCVGNVIRDGGVSCDADAGTPARSAYALAAQLDATHKNALLLCPEVAFDRATGDPGNLGAPNGFAALLDETLADLRPVLGPLTHADVRRLVVASHSGGYEAAASIATQGGVPVNELYLLDSLYGKEKDFDDWVLARLPAIALGPSPDGGARFADVYTCCGGTLANSQAMADRAASWVNPDAGVLVDDRTTGTWPTATYDHGLLFKSSALTHDGVPRYYFGRLIATSGLSNQ